MARDLQFKDLGDGLTVAQITEGRGDAAVRQDSIVLVELVGRLVGKQGWTFEDSREDGDPYRLQLGQGLVVEGLERALVGARCGRGAADGRALEARVRRPREGPVRDPESARWREVVQFLTRLTATQVPRSPAFRNRLYGTVLNDNRKTQETAGLGADVAGVVAFDVKVLKHQAAAMRVLQVAVFLAMGAFILRTCHGGHAALARRVGV